MTNHADDFANAENAQAGFASGPYDSSRFDVGAVGRTVGKMVSSGAQEVIRPNGKAQARVFTIDHQNPFGNAGRKYVG